MHGPCYKLFQGSCALTMLLQESTGEGVVEQAGSMTRKVVHLKPDSFEKAVISSEGWSHSCENRCIQTIYATSWPFNRLGCKGMDWLTRSEREVYWVRPNTALMKTDESWGR
jgi:hypothetical protein